MFLDLPGPWKAIPSVARCLKRDGVFCGFSPCIEQVQRTVEALNSEGFRAFTTIEILLREYEITNDEAAGDGELLEKMLIAQVNPRLHQRRRGRGGGRGDGQGREKKAKIVEEENNNNEDDTIQEEKEDAIMEEEEEEEEEKDEVAVEELPKVEYKTTETAAAGGAVGAPQEQPNTIKKESVVRARPIVQGRGHTGYLTFARKAVDFEK